MKGLMVKVPVFVILAAMLGACSTTQVGDSTTAVPAAGGTVTGTVVDNSNTNNNTNNNNNAGSGATVVIAPQENATSEHFVVQLIASASSQKAEGIQREFVSEGYQAYISQKVVAGRALHRVQVGPYSSEADAYSVLQSMRKRYQSNIYVNTAVVKTVNGS